MVRDLGLISQKIDCCENGCMLYWKADENLVECKFYQALRYEVRRDEGRIGKGKNSKKIPVKRMHYLPLIPRLQRLYASADTAKNMR